MERLASLARRRRGSLITLPLAIGALVVVWFRQGAMIAWVTALALADFAVELRLFGGLMLAGWRLYQGKNTSRNELRLLVLLATGAAALHLLSPAPLGDISMAAIGIAAVFAVVFTKFRRS
jgi:pimeloyl-ACP methyl ester carboxylesterase